VPKTEPHCPGLRGELLLLGAGKLNGSVKAFAELGVFLGEALDFLEELLSRRATGELTDDSAPNLACVVVDGLPAAIGLVGLLRDCTVARRESGGSIDDPESEGYGAHGVDILECRILTNPHSWMPPPPHVKRTWHNPTKCQVKTSPNGYFWDDANEPNSEAAQGPSDQDVKRPDAKTSGGERTRTAAGGAAPGSAGSVPVEPGKSTKQDNEAPAASPVRSNNEATSQFEPGSRLSEERGETAKELEA